MVVAIHGGAGALSKEVYSEKEQEDYHRALARILESSFNDLSSGARAFEVVTRAVCALEDEPLFNAGRGSVFDAEGKMSFDASLMCGETLRVGGVTKLKRMKNPILAAKWVLENSPHTLIAGSYLEDQLVKSGLEFADIEYFKTEKRYEQFLEAKSRNQIMLDHGNSNTVGAVALDKSGHLAAATSTGGMTYKYPGRVSDSSIVGAGTYANDSTCAVSGTGTGDVFIQHSLSHYIHCLMSLKGLSLEDSCNKAIQLLEQAGGFGGVIAVNGSGEVAMPFSSGGMFRAYQKSSGESLVAIF